MSKTVSVPVSLLKKMSSVANVVHDFEDEFEDFLLANDPEFVAEMHQARREHLKGDTSSLADLKKELCTE